MARARDEFDAEAFEVVDGLLERLNFELAAVARARIDLTDAERATEQCADLGVQMLGDAQRVVDSGGGSLMTPIEQILRAS